MRERGAGVKCVGEEEAIGAAPPTGQTLHAGRRRQLEAMMVRALEQ